MTTTELHTAAATFYAETKVMFPSCKFAALNIYGARADWEAWGDFRLKSEALQCGRLWARTFGKGYGVAVVEGRYRVTAGV
jgi:hypothetical protein